MVRRELTHDQWSLIVKRDQWGETISITLDGTKWRQSSKSEENMRRSIRYWWQLVMEAAKSPTATLKELQEFMVRTGCVIHVTTMSRILHMLGMGHGIARQKSSLTKKKNEDMVKIYKFLQNHVGNVCYGQIKPSSLQSTKRAPYPVWSTVVVESYCGDAFLQLEGGGNYALLQIPLTLGTKTSVIF